MLATHGATVGPASASAEGSCGGAFLEVEGLVKVFPGTRALDGVNIRVGRGEIHALLGENGAGKSTLIRQICGASQPTEGRILVEGREVSLPSPHAAAALGIAVVHQHFNLVPQITVCENLFLTEGLPRRGGVFVHWGEAYRRARALLSRVGLDIDPRAMVSDLRPDEAAMVAIAKAMGADARLIILDEPTAALLPGEVGVLFGHMRRLAAEGHAFLYVSHRLAEVFEIADCVTVLRDGRNAGHWRRSDMARREIINAIVGQKSFSEAISSAPVRQGDVLLRSERLGGGRVAEMSFELRAHEIVGVAGLPGSGAEEALDLLYGRFPATGGRLVIAGAPVAFRSPRDAKAAGLALAPKDRHAESLLPGASVRENISLPNLRRFAADPVFRFIRRGKERAEAQSVAKRLSVKMAGVESPIASLSGGNQQKAILGRWLMSGAKIFMLNSPTAAVDIGAKAEIYDLIRQIAHDGAGVIFTSTEVEEFPRVCHRVLVFRDGRIAGELVGQDATEANILNLAAGGAE
ncbi:ribose transport system ATP-binding protein/L-arabinose transport system ATP-binding protein [Roseiarcus fermentans]|uniref:Ribose transport system ATP-binding protein/L-arabinose transport system ATP-binding protein n=1 Tax=Roseiarcus fermentans TaxID=1473586 RepID=A0A366FU91_9HYPH|nr:sugar ABC transporter ATP-binding protein [Roseiarcus fermentans]RBP17620.1 ribose transport system ATP-binding protein/L-arabinose transport system ATP-binding protein [Roseiarcus fermentans]